MAMREWRDTLNGVPDEAIKHALDECRRGGEWPPSLPEFRTMCVGAQGESAERARQRAALPPPVEYPAWDDKDPMKVRFRRKLDMTNRRIREKYGDDPQGGYRDFLDQCEAQGMAWAAKHFTRAKA